jgi:hypothetical protein
MADGQEIGFVPRGPLSAAVKAEIEQQVADLVPPDRTGATLVVLDPNGAKAVVATKLGDHWTLAGEASSTWGGDVSGRVLLTGSW